MSLRRAVGSLLARATPRAAPARSFHSLRDLPIGDGAAGVAGAAVVALAAGGALAVQYFKKGTAAAESAARNKEEEDMKARFGDWMKKHGKYYKDEEEKAMRFQRFKASVEWLESQPPSVQKRFSPELGYLADSTEQEQRAMMPCPDELDRTQYSMLAMEIMAQRDKAALVAAGALAVQPSKKRTAARNKEEDMKARFEDWMEEHSKFYKDEEEKAMRFQLFKATVDRFSSPPETLNYFADWTDQELRKLEANPPGLNDDDEDYEKIVKCVLAKGGPVMVIRDVIKGGMRAAQDVTKGDTQAARDVKKGGTQVSA